MQKKVAATLRQESSQDVDRVRKAASSAEPHMARTWPLREAVRRSLTRVCTNAKQLRTIMEAMVSTTATATAAVATRTGALLRGETTNQPQGLMDQLSSVIPVTLTREGALTWSTGSQRWIVRPPKAAGLPRRWTRRVRNG